MSQRHGQSSTVRGGSGEESGLPAGGSRLGGARSKTDRPFVIVAGADFRPANDGAVEQAARMAFRIPKSELHVIHAAHRWTCETRVAEIARQLGTSLSRASAALGIHLANVGIHVRCGEPPREITALAAELDADMIVVGTRHPPYLRSLYLGSVADRVERSATCAVLLASLEHQRSGVCDDCEGVRALSARTHWWCERHAEHHGPGHAYTYHRELPFAQHDSAVLATGADTYPSRHV